MAKISVENFCYSVNSNFLFLECLKSHEFCSLFLPLIMTDTGIRAKCSILSCITWDIPLEKCGNKNCLKCIHITCYHDRVLRGSKNNKALEELPDNLVACTQVCYKAILKEKSVRNLKSNDSRRTWNLDGKGGADNPHNSMKILMDWLTNEGNYKRCRGKDNSGVKKSNLQRFWLRRCKMREHWRGDHQNK